MSDLADILAQPVLSISDTARVLRLLRRNGEPNRRAVHGLIRSGALRVVDGTQPVHRWTVSSAEIGRYIDEGPRVPPLVVAPNPDVIQPPVRLPHRSAS